jgi:hypothetical protein
MGEEAVAVPETGFVGLGDDGTIRVNVYREAFWLPLRPTGLTFRHPRPAALPCSLDMVLWGGMYTVINDICAATNSALFRAYLLCVLLAEFLVCCPLIWPWKFWMIYFDNRLYLAYSLIVCIACLWFAWGLTRRTIAAMHRSLDTALDEKLAPYFKRAGFRVQLLETMTKRFSMETCIVIQPLARVVGSGPIGRSHFDPTLHMKRRASFRVPVYGRCVDRSIMRFFVSSSDYHTFGAVRHDDVAALIDLWTWGAVATELAPETHLYLTLRTATAIMLLGIFQLLAVFLIEGMDFFSVYLIIFPTLGLYTRWMILDHWNIAAMPNRMEEKVRALSPVVANFSGYTLDFAVEKEACCSTSGYVIFQANMDRGVPQRPGLSRHAVGATVV